MLCPYTNSGTPGCRSAARAASRSTPSTVAAMLEMLPRVPGERPCPGWSTTYVTYPPLASRSATWRYRPPCSCRPCTRTTTPTGDGTVHACQYCPEGSSPSTGAAVGSFSGRSPVIRALLGAAGRVPCILPVPAGHACEQPHRPERSADRPIRSGMRTVTSVVRPFRQQIDEGILDRAAALFARRGFTKTSLQDVADAVGLSKPGLLHHFPSKEALHDAVRAQAAALGRRVLDQVGDLPLGPERDRHAIEVLVDVAIAHPGLVALLLSPVLEGGAVVCAPEVDAAGAALQAFGVDPQAPASERSVRVVGALA